MSIWKRLIPCRKKKEGQSESNDSSILKKHPLLTVQNTISAERFYFSAESKRSLIGGIIFRQIREIEEGSKSKLGEVIANVDLLRARHRNPNIVFELRLSVFAYETLKYETLKYEPLNLSQNGFDEGED